MRIAEINRNTNETKIKLKLNLDGRGDFSGSSGIGFFDHMLELFAHHGRFNIDIECNGDTHVDFHHTVEDIGISLGQAFKLALGDSKGIVRYGSFILPMDESLVSVALDFSGRNFLYYDVDILREKVGEFDTELCEEFFTSFSRNCGMTLHIKLEHGTNAHHIIEACFKGVARAIRQAIKIDSEYADEIPSTKGVL